MTEETCIKIEVSPLRSDVYSAVGQMLWNDTQQAPFGLVEPAHVLTFALSYPSGFQQQGPRQLFRIDESFYVGEPAPFPYRSP